MRRQLRRLAGWVALLAFCFTQLAMSAHACSVMDETLRPAVAVTEQPSPCDGMGGAPYNESSALCLEHCKGAFQAADQHSPVPPVAAAPAAALIVPHASQEGGVRLVSTHAPPAPPDPLPVLASSSRLRI